MTLAIPKRANSELVAAAYLRSITAAYDAAVGTTLQGPDPETNRIKWANSGFIQVGAINGSININVPIRRPVVSVTVFATAPGQSKRPPWDQAFALAELLVAATFDVEIHRNHSVVTLPSGYPAARVMEFSALTEPARRNADQSDFAQVGFDVALTWHGLGDSWSVPS